MRTHARSLFQSSFLLVVSLMVMACSSMKVSSEKSPGVDLSRYRTFRFLVDEGEAGMGNRPKDPVLDQNIRDALETSLISSGFTLVPSGVTPDFTVDYHVTSETQTVTTPGTVGVGSGAGYVSGYMWTPPTIETYREGSLIVDFIDGHTHTPFWRGVATARLNGYEESVKKARDAAQKIVSQYQEQGSKASS